MTKFTVNDDILVDREVVITPLEVVFASTPHKLFVSQLPEG